MVKVKRHSPQSGCSGLPLRERDGKELEIRSAWGSERMGGGWGGACLLRRQDKPLQLVHELRVRTSSHGRWLALTGWKRESSSGGSLG